MKEPVGGWSVFLVAVASTSSAREPVSAVTTNTASCSILTNPLLVRQLSVRLPVRERERGRGRERERGREGGGPWLNT